MCWSVFPLVPGQKVPQGGTHGLRDATTDEERIREWWSASPNANIGGRTGDSYWVLDVDPRHEGDRSMVALTGRYGPLPSTLRQQTGGGGDQYFFQPPGAAKIPTRAPATDYKGIDTRGEGGYVVLPPSVHPSGGIYAWRDRVPPGIQPIEPAPAWLIELILRHKCKRKIPIPEHIAKGAQHDTLRDFGILIRRAGGEYEDILAALWSANQNRLDEPDDSPRQMEDLSHWICENIPRGPDPETPTPAFRGPVAPLPQFDSRPDGMFHATTTKKGEAIEVRLTNWRAAVETVVTLDDGVETIREFDINAELMGRASRFLVSAPNFAAMNWPIEQMGPAAITFPHRREHARTAVQSFSLAASEQRVYTHTGWRQVDGRWLYLNAGAAIGQSGAVPDVNIRLSGPLARYELQIPAGPDQLTRAVRASLRLLELGPPAIAFPLAAARSCSIFGGANCAIHLSGATGNFKSERAALEQQHFGAGLNSRNLPGSWASTANALETLAFLAKDAVLVIDDFAPQGSAVEIARMHAAADRVFRAAGNHSGRGRLDATAKLRDVKPPRSMIISTGEEVPNGQSIRARLLILELAKGEINADLLSQCQRDAAAGLYAQAMGGFVQWVAAKYEDLRAGLSRKLMESRAVAVQAGNSSAHARTADITATLCAGFELYLQFAEQCGAIDAGERERLENDCRTALAQAAAAQSGMQAASDPAIRFIDLVAACLSSGRAHLAGPDGTAPARAPEACGWRERLVSEVEQKEGGEVKHKKVAVPVGDCIGWVDDDGVYLDPLASHRQAQLMASSEPLAITVRTLEKRLLEKGMLATHGKDRGAPIRKTLAGSRKAVLHFHRKTILPGEADQGRGEEGADPAKGENSQRAPQSASPHHCFDHLKEFLENTIERRPNDPNAYIEPIGIYDAYRYSSKEADLSWEDVRHYMRQSGYKESQDRQRWLGIRFRAPSSRPDLP
jgi:hypothetical protein